MRSLTKSAAGEGWQANRVKEEIRISAECARRFILDVAILKPAVLRTAVRTSLKRSGLA